MLGAQLGILKGSRILYKFETFSFFFWEGGGVQKLGNPTLQVLMKSFMAGMFPSQKTTIPFRFKFRRVIWMYLSHVNSYVLVRMLAFNMFFFSGSQIFIQNYGNSYGKKKLIRNS